MPANASTHLSITPIEEICECSDSLAQPRSTTRNHARVVTGTTRVSTVFVVGAYAALCDVLEANGHDVETFADGQAFLACDRPRRRGCLLLNASMPEIAGIELIKQMQCSGQHLPTILLSEHGGVPMAVQALRAGAYDFLQAPVATETLLASIDEALRQDQVAASLDTVRRLAERRVEGLTARQHEIMDLVAAGHPSKNIAADLGISQRTVDSHRAAIMKRTGSRSLPDLIRTAFCSNRCLSGQLEPRTTDLSARTRVGASWVDSDSAKSH